MITDHPIITFLLTFTQISAAMRKLIYGSILLLSFHPSMSQQPPPPDKIYGELFVEVQMQKVFPDGKTFVDCIPKRKPADIMYDYGMQKGPNFNLKKFVEENFELPANPIDNYKTNKNDDVTTHIKNLWTVLKRNPDKPVEGSSLLAFALSLYCSGWAFP